VIRTKQPNGIRRLGLFEEAVGIFDKVNYKHQLVWFKSYIISVEDSLFQTLSIPNNCVGKRVRARRRVDFYLRDINTIFSEIF